MAKNIRAFEGGAVLMTPEEVDAAIERVKGGNPADFLGDDSLGAGLQMALYDLVGKALGVPVYRLFNLPRAREWCPISWWNIDMPPEAYAAEAKEALIGFAGGGFSRGLAYVTLKGRRGGSALAAAAVNALAGNALSGKAPG